MSINPIPAIGGNEAQLPDVHSGRGETPSVSSAGETPASGTLPKREIPAPQTTPASAEPPQDEVQVQRDSGTGGEIVIRYLDHAGNVVLQVPTSQMLGVMRAIDQDFAQEAKARESIQASERASSGGKDHGH